MFAVNLNTASPPYVTGYTVMGLVQYNALYTGSTSTIFVKQTDLQGPALQRFIAGYWKYYYQNGKLVFDTTAF